MESASISGDILVGKKLFLGLTTEKFDLHLTSLKSQEDYTIKYLVYVIPKDYVRKNLFIDKKNKQTSLYCMYFDKGKVSFSPMTDDLFNELVVADDDMSAMCKDVFMNLNKLTYIRYSNGSTTFRYLYNELVKKYLEPIVFKIKMLNNNNNQIIPCKLVDIVVPEIKTLEDVENFLNSSCVLEFIDGNRFEVPVLLYLLMKNTSEDFTYKSVLRLEKSEKDIDFAL